MPAEQEPPSTAAVAALPRSATFPHKTSASTTTRTPFIDTDTPAINTAPVELDATSASASASASAAAAAAAELRGTAVGGDRVVLPGSIPGADDAGALRQRSGSVVVVVSPDLHEEDAIEREFLGEPGALGEGECVREKRAAFLANRSRDPGVIVDVPRDPTAEEVEAARKTPLGLQGR